MDEILGIIAIVISVSGTILAVVNHSRIRSNCCGKKAEISFDVDKTTPVLPPRSIEEKENCIV
jgi:hypothetical protein